MVDVSGEDRPTAQAIGLGTFGIADAARYKMCMRDRPVLSAPRLIRRLGVDCLDAAVV